MMALAVLSLTQVDFIKAEYKCNGRMKPSRAPAVCFEWTLTSREREWENEREEEKGREVER